MNTLKIQDPATGTVIRELESDTPASVAEKFKTAARAQKDWAKAPLSRRLEAIRKLRALVVERKEKLAGITSSETGKPISQARNELAGLAARIDLFLAETAKTLAPEM